MLSILIRDVFRLGTQPGLLDGIVEGLNATEQLRDREAYESD